MRGKSSSIFGDSGLGVHVRERAGMELVMLVYHFWNAVFGSELAGLFTSRK